MGNAVATRPDTAVQVIGMVDSRADQFRDLLGGDERLYERFRTVAIHAVTSNPNILQCDPVSIIEAVRDSAAMGLELNGLMGEAYVIPYKGKAQFQVGWRGLLRLARRSGSIAGIDAQCVYEHDDFDIDLGSEPKVTHKPSLGERGNRTGAYAYARLTSGELVIEWMPNVEIEMVRRSSKSKDSGPWVQWPDEMARKTVIKRLAKRLPLDSLAQQALELEAQADNAADAPSRPVPRNGRHGPTAPVQRVHERLGITSSGSDGAADGSEVSADEPPHAADPGAPAGISESAPSDPDQGTTAEAGTKPAPSVGADGGEEAGKTTPASSPERCEASPPDDDPLGLSSGGPCGLTGTHRVHRNSEGTWPA